jgi:hypothetical protein
LSSSFINVLNGYARQNAETGLEKEVAKAIARLTAMMPIIGRVGEFTALRACTAKRRRRIETA